MAKKKSRIKNVVETVEGWVGMGPKAKTATKKGAAKPANTSKKKSKTAKSAKKGKKAGKKKTKKK